MKASFLSFSHYLTDLTKLFLLLNWWRTIALSVASYAGKILASMAKHVAKHGQCMACWPNYPGQIVLWSMADSKNKKKQNYQMLMHVRIIFHNTPIPSHFLHFSVAFRFGEST